MPSWWGKSSSKEVKRKANRESILDTIQRKLKNTSEEKCNNKSGGSRRYHSFTVSEKESRTLIPSRSPSPSTHVSRCQSFAERPHPQPLPLPGLHLPTVSDANSGINLTSKLERVRGSKPSLCFPLPKPGYVSNRGDLTDAEGDIATASVSSDSSIDSGDSSDSHLISPLASDYENGNRAAVNTSLSVAHKDESRITVPKTSRASSKPAPQMCNNKLLSTSPKRGPLHLQNLQTAHPGGLCSAPDSSMSSPSRSPMRALGPEHLLNSGFCTGKTYPDLASRQCSSPGSGHNSGHNLIGGDLLGQMFWRQNKCSPECSPIPSPRMTSPGPGSRIHSGAITPWHLLAGVAGAESPTAESPVPSPRMTSPGPSSRIQSGAVTPLHPWAGGAAAESPTAESPIPSPRMMSPGPSSRIQSGAVSPLHPWAGGAAAESPTAESPIPSPRMTSPAPSSRIQSGAVTPLHPRAGGAAAELPTRRPDDVKRTHRLPLPPITVTNSCPFSPPYSASTTPSAPRSPARAENPTSPGSRWKKGQLLGRGTFGHVYLGFDRESGEMCAMKEVTLFSDDAKSRECAQQLGQEIALLSRLRHPNIVQYYGSETVDDKLYIYLEYISGGSIYKLLQEYGQFGESAIRNYTRQILSGLAYLHAKNTVHRDIKGANILVDPNGWIKLADFGMAKHISGQSCPFSFKGSPYWMAPEVIKNSNGCNLAVDIWSLGCTVLEMATTKPPWSKYEGVAAVFKIGNSKELPEIPGHLSEDGKDFVRLCLQRNPLNRPSAAQLLEHPFVKNATLERPILTADPAEGPPAVINAMKSLAIGPAKHNLCLDSEVAGIYPSRSLRAGSGSSGAHTPRNISCPVSPNGSQLLPSLHVSGRMSPSPISSPPTASGSSTPLTSGGGAIPFHQAKLPICEAMGNGFISHGGTAYQERKHDQFWGIPPTNHACRDVISSDNGALANRRVVQRDPREFHDGKSYLADYVSQTLLRDYVRLNTSLDPKPSAPMLGRINGI